MNIAVYPSKSLGIITLPASKSDLHRAIIASSLANGESVIEDITLSNDIEATIEACKAFGANIIQEKNKLLIKGIEDFSKVNSTNLYVNESGSTLRFLIPILSLFEKEFIIKGEKNLFSRPLGIYQKIYQSQNLFFDLKEKSLKIKGKIKADRFEVRGDVSSQFISGLLFALPLLDKSSTLKILPPFESESYVGMTIRTLNKFGVVINRISRYEFYIEGNQKYCPTVYKVEKDFSHFAFYAVLGAINNDVTCRGLNINSIQGDRIILDILKYFNIHYSINNNEITIHKCDSLQGSIINLSDCIDLGPILMVMSLFSNIPVKITNIKRLKYKESNRINAMVENIQKVNGKVEVFEDYLIIYPSKLKKSKEVLNPYNDHRVMMALIVLASKIKGKTLISNPECIKKSYITFYKDIQSLGVQIGLVE